jgi:hypothetical protein
MVEISRDGKRVYWTNSLYSTWDNQLYPDGVPGVEVMANASGSGGLELAKDYWVSFPCRPNVQMSVPSNLKMSVSPAFWRALGGDSGGGAECERCRTEAS